MSGLVFKSSGGDSTFHVEGLNDTGGSSPGGGGEGGEEDLGPGLPPLFQSNSSVNVYMPTKLRRAGSHTTGGTYAEAMNNQRQELPDARGRDRGGGGGLAMGSSGESGGSGGSGSRPTSMSTTATGDELINMDHFNSSSSGRHMRVQGFDSNSSGMISAGGAGGNLVRVFLFVSCLSIHPSVPMSIFFFLLFLYSLSLPLPSNPPTHPPAFPPNKTKKTKQNQVFRQHSTGSSSLGVGSRPTSLDGRCIDAIMELGSSSGDNHPNPSSSSSYRNINLDSAGGLVIPPMPLPPLHPPSASVADDTALNVSVAHGVDSPVFAAAAAGSSNVPSLPPLPPTHLGPGGDLQEPMSVPGLEGNYSNKSTEWFPDGPAPLPGSGGSGSGGGGGGGGSGGSAPSYIANAFRDDSSILGSSGGASSAQRGVTSPLPHISVEGGGGGEGGGGYARQQRVPGGGGQMLPPGYQQQQVYPPGPQFVMPVPLPQGYGAPAHYAAMPPASQPYIPQAQPMPHIAMGGSGGGRGGGGGGGHHARASSGASSALGSSVSRSGTGEYDGSQGGSSVDVDFGEDKKGGRYKCRYCGEIKRQHVCSALIDIRRASTETQVGLWFFDPTLRSSPTSWPPDHPPTHPSTQIQSPTHPLLSLSRWTWC